MIAPNMSVRSSDLQASFMTRGGPTYSTEVLATMLYREAFELNHMGVASAIAVILVTLVLSIARVQTFVLDEAPEGGKA